MPDITTTKRPTLKYFHHNDRRQDPHVAPRTPLPPREHFEGLPDVLEALDAMANLSHAIDRHGAEQARLLKAADAARQQRFRDVRQAQASGVKPEDVPDPEPGLRAEAAKHEGWKADAKTAAVEHGRVLASLLLEHADTIIAGMETRMHDAADKALEALEVAERAQEEWNSLWGSRRVIGALSVRHGRMDSHHGTTDLGGMDIRERVAQLEQLREEETYMRGLLDHGVQ